MSWREGNRTPGWWAAAAVGVALFALDLAGQLEDGIVKGSSVLYFVAMGIAMATGLWVWAWRPQTHMGL
jgi:hypothetical protein